MEIFDLQRFRKDKKLTQKKVAILLECEQSFVSAIESGKRLMPKEKMSIIESQYGDISDYITTKDDTILSGITPLDLLNVGSEAFTRQIVTMMNDKLIAPYGLLEEKDKEIALLNREIGKLEALLDNAKKTDAQVDGNAIYADAK